MSTLVGEVLGSMSDLRSRHHRAICEPRQTVCSVATAQGKMHALAAAVHGRAAKGASDVPVANCWSRRFSRRAHREPGRPGQIHSVCPKPECEQRWRDRLLLPRRPLDRGSGRIQSGSPHRSRGQGHPSPLFKINNLIFLVPFAVLILKIKYGLILN